MDKVYSISEIFTSPQGEGRWAGHLMTFIRLAGCSVGKPFPKERYQTLCTCSDQPDFAANSHAPGCAANTHGLRIYTEQCTLYDGRTFECDTDYRVKERLTVEQIIERVDAPRVCISGGEPFIHDLYPLVYALFLDHSIHIETSGTRSLAQANLDKLDNNLDNRCAWIAVSPKWGVRTDMLARADEIKLLIDKDFNEDALVYPQGHASFFNSKLVYIQPVNFEHTINDENMKLCIELQKKHKTWIISTQAHKSWKVR